MIKRNFNALPLIFLFLIPVLLFSQTWVRRYNGPGNGVDKAYALTVDNSGNIYVTGLSAGSGTGKDYLTIKYNAQGNQLWVARYNGPGNVDDEAYAIAVDNLGNVYVTGLSGLDYATVKYDANGNQLWVARYNGNGLDFANAIAVDNSGNVYVTGLSEGTSYDYATIKYDANGNELWVRRYNGPGSGLDRANAIAVDNSGNVYVTGTSEGSGSATDYATIKYDANGNELWVRRYNGPGNNHDYAHALALDGSGNLYVTGSSIGSGTNYDYATVKYDPDGNQLWVRRYNGPVNGIDIAYALVVDDLGDIYVTGTSVGSGTAGDYATVKYNTDGDELWVARYNGPGNITDEAHAIALDNAGNVYVTGWSTGVNTSDDYATIKYDREGNQIGLARYNGPANGTDRAHAVGVDNLGNVYVTGESQGSTSGYDYATIKYQEKDVGCVRILAPTGTINQGTVINPACSLYNYGITTVSYTVRMKIGNLYNEIATVTNHAPSTSLYITFPNWTASELGTFAVSCSTELSGDMDNTNDKRGGSVIVRIPGPAGTWQKLSVEVPTNPSGKKTKSGGLIVNGGDKIYIVKGNNTKDFYSFTPENAPVWIDSLPIIGKKGVKKGTALVYDGTRWLYFASGTNTLQFWKYDTQGESGWVALPNIPQGGGKALKGGTGMVYVNGFVYLLKGSKTNEFYAFDCANNTWLQDLPSAPGDKGYGDGSCLIAYDNNTLYALRGKYNEFYKYDISNKRWDRDSSIPFVHPLVNDKKKVGEGAAMVLKDGKIFAFKGNNTKEFWLFDPTTKWVDLETIPKMPEGKYVKGGGGLCTWADGTIYALKGNNTTSIWKYTSADLSSVIALSDKGTQELRGKSFIKSLRINSNLTNSLTKVYYNLPKREMVTLKIYNTLGNLVYWAKSDKGEFTIKRLPVGIYLLRFESKGYKEEEKLIVVK